VAFTDKISLVDLGSGFFIFVLIASSELSVSCVWSIISRNGVVSLLEDAVEDAPTTVAAFVHEVALERELRGEIVLFAVVEHDP
jgi:hypothetical protein